MKVLVTSGPTREPIDSVRFISNLSSGQTGAAICTALAGQGFEVTQVYGTGSAVAPAAGRHEAFTDHASLVTVLRRLLQEGSFGAVIHTAAVGDYSVADPQLHRKLASGGERVLCLRPNPKVIDQIRACAPNPDLLLIGFKFTHEQDAGQQASAVRTLLQRSGSDYVVHNDLATWACSSQHVYVIHSREGDPLERCTGRQALAQALATLLQKYSMGRLQ